MSRRLDYSKWDHIEVSDDEDDTHPNIDTGSLFRWRHQARVERMQQEEQEKAKFLSESTAHKKKLAEVEKKMKELDISEAQKELEKLKAEEKALKQKEEELTKKERLAAWNVDTLSKPGFEKTIINKGEKPQEKHLSDEERHKELVDFIEKYEDEIKKFGMLKDYNESRDYLRDHPHLVCTNTTNFLTMWCVNLEVQDKHALMQRVAHQVIVMQYILELAKQIKRDPRSCVPGFFERMKSTEKTYLDAFEDELKGFKERVESRAQARIEEATRVAEEEARQKRLGPGGVDPVEVMETLPIELKECFESRSISKLQDVLAGMSKEDAAYHMKRCVDSGLWVTDAKAAGLTPASEELQKIRAEGSLEAQADDDSDGSGDGYDVAVDGVNKDDLGLD